MDPAGQAAPRLGPQAQDELALPWQARVRARQEPGDPSRRHLRPALVGPVGGGSYRNGAGQVGEAIDGVDATRPAPGVPDGLTTPAYTGKSTTSVYINRRGQFADLDRLPNARE